MRQRVGPYSALACTLLLSALFLGVYGGCNWLTAQRTDVGRLYFDWELGIPFVSWMIVPYMSIDAFFICAPFLCRGHAELRRHGRRVTFAIIAAGLCFLAFPLRLGFPRQSHTGWLGAFFDSFCAFDAPHNLLPSLHITLRTILAALYGRLTSGPVRGLLRVWFSLIGASTVLTHQHHLADVAGGAVLAAFALHLIPDEPATHEVVPNRRVAVYYAAGAAAVAALAFALRPWGVTLLWPGMSLAVASLAYFDAGANLYRKQDGRIPWSARIALGPLLLGQWASLQYYRRRSRAWDAVEPGLLLGRRLTRREAERAVREEGITAVLDLAAEFSEARAFRRLRYMDLPVLDLTAPTAATLRRAAAFLTEEAARGKVYVHCKIGYSRSACAVGAYLLASGKARSVEEAIALLRKARPAIIVRPEATAALRAFAGEGRSSQPRAVSG